MKIQFMSKTFCRVPVTAHWALFFICLHHWKQLSKKALHSIDFINMWAWTPIGCLSLPPVIFSSGEDLFIPRLCSIYGKQHWTNCVKAAVSHREGVFLPMSYKASHQFLTSVGLMCYAWERFPVWYGRWILWQPVCVFIYQIFYIFRKI